MGMTGKTYTLQVTRGSNQGEKKKKERTRIAARAD